MALLIAFVFSASGVVTLLMVAALWMWWRPHSQVGRRGVIALACVYAIASIDVVPDSFSRLWTIGFHQLTRADVPTNGNTAIVLLGGSDHVIVGWDGHLSITTAAVTSRVIEAQRMFRATDAAWIISSGGAPTDPIGSVPAGISMRDTLVTLGVPRDRILIETASQSTYDEAETVVAMLAPLRIDHVVLVTSASHMRRSLGTFKKAGLTAVPAIARRVDPPKGLDRFRPTEGALRFSRELAHEVVGLTYYWVRGWWQP